MADPVVDLAPGPARIRVLVPALPVPSRLAVPGTPHVRVVPVAGSQGPPGADAATYTHHQVEPSSTWVIEHHLGRRPAVVLFLDEDLTEPVYTDLHYLDEDTVAVDWPTPATGYAYL